MPDDAEGIKMAFSLQVDIAKIQKGMSIILNEVTLIGFKLETKFHKLYYTFIHSQL